MLANIALYWFTGAIGSSFWPYYARMHGPWPIPEGATVDVPMGYAEFPREILRPPRSLAARTFTDIRRWSVMQRGGHFAAMEQPEALAEEVRAFFRPLRRRLRTGEEPMTDTPARPVREAWAAGRAARNAWLTFPDAHLAETVAARGVDRGRHRRSAARAVRPSLCSGRDPGHLRPTGCAPLVRLAAVDMAVTGYMLDAGAAGRDRAHGREPRRKPRRW